MQTPLTCPGQVPAEGKGLGRRMVLTGPPARGLQCEAELMAPHLQGVLPCGPDLLCLGCGQGRRALPAHLPGSLQDGRPPSLRGSKWPPNHVSFLRCRQFLCHRAFVETSKDSLTRRKAPLTPQCGFCSTDERAGGGRLETRSLRAVRARQGFGSHQAGGWEGRSFSRTAALTLGAEVIIQPVGRSELALSEGHKLCSRWSGVGGCKPLPAHWDKQVNRRDWRRACHKTPGLSRPDKS